MAILEEISTGVGTELAKPLVNKAIEEAGYLCCHQSYVDDFDDQRKKLKRQVGSVHEDIKDARDRNETRIDPVVQGWLDEAHALIQQDTQSKNKWFFGLCLNCYRQNRRSKELKVKTQVIKDLITRRSNLPPVARSAESLGIELYSSPDFMRFESRKLKYEQLQEALKDESHHMIGLQGMGGTGKTTMATQVGKELQQQKVFDKVIFTVVSNADQPADVIKIRGDIARQLKFELKEGKESEHAYQLSTRISTGGEKILIVLDDVWQKLPNLTDYGIPLGQHEKGRCSVLITTRNLRVLRDMGCKMVIQLEPLSADDALKLFLFHSGKSGDDDFKDVALRIVNECGRLPVAIVPLARALYSGSLEYWNDTLTRLQNFNPMSHDVPEDLIDAYKSLRLSYDNLKEYPSAQKLFLLCSLFPEDFEIPLELLTRIAISMGLCAEADKYYIARSQVSNVQHKLFDSCLLSKVAAEPDELNFSEFLTKAANKCVKMHDLIREVALSIAKEEIQVIMDSKSTLKENIQCSSWNINGFPDRFDGGELQFLLLMIKTERSVQVPDGLFKGVMNLRVLLLICTNDSRIPAPSLMKSTLPLVNIQTLSLSNWELGDISVIGILQSLETLELIKCSIIELSSEVVKLKKLRLLGLRDCKIESENPFKVIEECPILEELYYVENEDILYSTDELDHIEPPATLERYHIVTDTYRSVEMDDSISRWFEPGYLSKIFSEATFKSLATRAEILELNYHDEDIELKGKDLFRGPLPIDILKNLVVLKIESCRCVEGTLLKGKLELGNLRSIRLESCSVTFLFDTSTAQSLKKLEKLEILKCERLKCIIADERSDVVLEIVSCSYLEGTLLKGKLELGNLRSIRLESCPVTFLFDTSTAQSLKKLETLGVYDCAELKCIIADERSDEAEVLDDPNQKGHGSLFNLKFLQVGKCPKLEFIFPIYFAENAQKLEEVSIDKCQELEYIFGQYSNAKEGSYQVILPSLKEVGIRRAPKLTGMFPAECCIVRSTQLGEDGLKVKNDHPSDSASNNVFSWAAIPICCFFPKSSETLPDHTTSQPQMVIKAKRDFNIAGCLMRSPLNPSFVTKMFINKCSSNNLTSLFTLSVASSMSSLEVLTVGKCNGLKHIVSSAEEGDGDDHMNHNYSIFPKLRRLQVKACELLEDVFPASHCTKLHHLEEVRVTGVPKLRYVFGKCSCQNHNVEILLPALKELWLVDAPNLVNICTENCFSKAISLQSLIAGNVPQHVIRPLIDFRVAKLETQDPTTTKVVETQPENLTVLGLGVVELDRIYDLEGLQTEGPVKSRLNELELRNLPLLTDICVGTRNILSFQNLQTLQISKCKKLQFIFSASILRSLPQLKYLEASKCPELLQIIEEDTQENSLVSQQNCFPQLRKIYVEKCDKLKCLFSISECGILPNLEELTIKEAPELMQIFGCKQGVSKQLKHVFPKLSKLQLHNLGSLESVCQGIEILLPALKQLSLSDAPNLVNICTENYFVKASSLEHVRAGNVPQHVIRPLIDFTVGKLETQDPMTTKVIEIQPGNLTTLYLDGNETDRIYDLEGLQTEGPVKSRLNVLDLENLPLLTDICVGTRNILSFQNLERLEISRCKKLQFIFSASILRSLPQLEILKASECPELLQVFQEDTDENSLVSQHNCFPRLSKIHVKKCDKLKCLFSITECGILPNLEELTIKEAPELMQVFGCKQGVSKELKHVFPQLSKLQLVDLESLQSVCQGIDFQMVSRRDVSRCPKISLTSTTEDTTSNNEESQAAKSQSMSSPPYISEEKTNQIVEDTSKRASNRTEIQEIEEEEACDDENGSKLNNSIIPYQTNIISEQSKSSQNESPQIQEIEEAIDQTIVSQSSKPSQAPCVIPYSQNESQQDMLVDEEAKKETKIMDQQAPTEKGPDMNSNNSQNDKLVGEGAKKETNIVGQEERIDETPDINDSQNNIEVSVGDDPPLEKDCKPTSSTSSKLGIKYPGQDAMVHEGSKNESTTMGQQAPAKATHDMHSNDSQNNIEVHDGEGSSLEKDNEATSSTSTKRVKEVTKSVVEEESANQEQNNGPPNLGVIMANQKIMDDITKADIKVPQQFEKDDLIRLFQIMEEGADMEVHTHHVSNIAAYEEADAKVAKAFVDLEASMKMNLNEIANSEEIRLGIQNALNFLSTHCFEDGTLSHGLKSKVDSLQHKIQTVVSSFKQASTTIHTFTELQGRENYMTNQEFPQRKEAAVNLVSEIDETEKSMLELKEHISRLQFELYSKEKEMKECETKLVSLQEKKKKSVWDTMKFMKELEDVKNDRSQMEEDQIKARHKLENSNSEWSTCVADLRKTITQLGIYLNHKI